MTTVVKKFPFLLYVLLGGILAGCGNDMADNKVAAIDNLENVNWEKINSASIFFGHKSVGSNLVDGLMMVKEKYPQFSMPIYDLGREYSGSPGLYQKMIGENKDAQSKMNDFFASEGRFSGNGSVVGMKFCYIDITRDTDVDALFDEYRVRVARYQRDNPNKRIIHFTAPLTSDATDIKSRIKKWLGKRVRGHEDNLQKQRYNELLLKEYGESAVFDIAKFESTLAGGARVSGRMDKQIYYAMSPGYTTDGGHLNGYGKEYLATEFVKFLDRYL